MIFLKDNTKIFFDNLNVENLKKLENFRLKNLVEKNSGSIDIEKYKALIGKSKIIDELKNKDLKTLLLENENLILFPNADARKLNEDSYIFEERKGELWTSSIAGFLSHSKEVKARKELVISSRFSNNTDLEDDHFLMYMLNKVMHYNITSQDFSFKKDKDSFLDIYMYLFPNQLEKADKQGLYKEYITKHYNDMNVRGTIDVQNFIKKNVPFTGKISYKTREFSYDNNVTQLIRHTLEFIKQKAPSLLKANHNISDCVRRIEQVTPSYNRGDRQKIITENMKKKLDKAFFSEYIKLQDLCLKILRHEKITYDNKKSQGEISGLIIDIAWLWEEYIGVVTSAQNGKKGVPKKENFKEKTWYKYSYKENPLYLFNSGKGHRYPDFTYGNIPIDTKYKFKIDERNDFNQVTTYMYMLKSLKGGFLKPVSDLGNNGELVEENENNTNTTEDIMSKKMYIKSGYHKVGDLVGHGGEMFVYNFKVPADKNYKEFVKKITKEEEKLQKLNFSNM